MRNPGATRWFSSISVSLILLAMILPSESVAAEWPRNAAQPAALASQLRLPVLVNGFIYCRSTSGDLVCLNVKQE